MSDKDLLKLAAKAAGIKEILCHEQRRNCLRIGKRGSYKLWSPRTDDGDSQRLAIKLCIAVYNHEKSKTIEAVAYKTTIGEECVSYTDDPYDAARLAVLRVAAAIGRRMP